MKTRVSYKIDKFVDYTGTEREFIIAAVSVPIKPKEFIYVPVIDPELRDSEDVGIDCEKYLLLGVSVRHKDDKFNEEIGKQIAVGKALKLKGKQLIVSSSGLINTMMVNALLEQEAEYFKRDPGSYISGYNDAKRKWINRSIK